jgi:hypothetical protein
MDNTQPDLPEKTRGAKPCGDRRNTLPEGRGWCLLPFLSCRTYRRGNHPLNALVLLPASLSLGLR